MSSDREERVKVLLALRKEYVAAIDQLAANGGASSRTDMVERIIGAFLSDLREKRRQNGALEALVGFLILLLGAAILSKILGGD